jgi:hypothetical protein
VLKYVQIKLKADSTVSALAMAALILCFAGTRSLQGQAPPPETGKETTAGQNGAAASKWIEDLTVGAQIDDGRSDTKAITANGYISRNYKWGVLRFDGSEAYGSIDAGGVRITSLDRQYGSASWTHKLTPVLHFTQINSIERDTIRLIDYRVSSLNVLGIQTKLGEKLTFDFGPGFAVVYQEKNTPQIDGLKFDGGAYYSLVYTIDPRWSIVHWATFREDVTNSSDLIIDSSISLTGKITKTIGIKLSATYNYEGILAKGNVQLGFNTRNYLTTTVGLNLHH